jgi:4'-phosphopantetheinyl transferase
LIGGFPAGPLTIYCWRLDLRCSDATLALLASALSLDERQRAARFISPRDRRRFVATRASLRVLLGHYCGERPRAIRLAYSEYGKPYLASGSTVPRVGFNVSHAADVALIALTADSALGVDVEEVRPIADLLAIASRFFTSAEVETITTVSSEERDLAFFLCWTRKEAFSKALGDGLTFELDRYRVACRPGAEARILEIDGSTAAAAAWSLYDLRPAPGYVGAVAMHGMPRTLDFQTLDIDTDIVSKLCE